MAFPASNVAPSGPLTSSAAKNPIAELRNGKVIFRQKQYPYDKALETMQEIVKFREMLESRVQSQDKPLESIPEEHKPLIVKLAQESDKSIGPLAKHVRSFLLPRPGEVEDVHRLSLESNLPLSVVEYAIRNSMTRINYGLDTPSGQKLPAAVCVWRWEVKDAYKDWLPRSTRENADVRLAERIQASADLRMTFGSLSQIERDAILDPKGSTKLPARDINKSEPESVLESNNEGFLNDALKDLPTDVPEVEALSENLAPKERMKKAVDSEKASKNKDKEEKRVAKAEKEKKQKEAQDRSRSIMANFFGKAKPPVRESPPGDSNASVGLGNEFQRTFKPFVLKKDAQLAPYNWFLEEKKRSRCCRMTGVTHAEAIVIDDEVPVKETSKPATTSDEMLESIASGNPPASLQDLVREIRRTNVNFCSATRKSSPFKTYNPRSVQDTVSQLNDAEIAGDPTLVRHLLSILQDRQIFPAKVLVFHVDSRPGYYGTWTRNSRVVGPRSPLERDSLAHDYSYDSGEEWEDEDADDADDVIEDGEDDEPDAEDADSDLDSWLVDDDDEVQPPLLDDLSLPPSDLPMPPPKRKAESSEKRSDKKRKVVVPLVPNVKGPFWESHIGACDYGPFHAYRIQLFNDTPHPIDPFTFTTAISEEGHSSQTNHFPGMVQPLATTVQSISKRTIPLAPKTVFPEAHLNTLLAKITELATPNLTFLVDSIYQALREHKVKKNAIEAKVRELGEKLKDKKIWVVKQAVQASQQR